MRLPGASSSVALASAVSLGAQLLFSLLLLRLFTPAAVGEFSVIGQMAFFWVTLALAQAPLKLLADLRLAPAQALRQNLRASLWRWAALLPVACVALWVSGGVHTAAGLAWTAALAILQMTWQLAQPLTLRRGSTNSIALVRMAPPLLALATAAAIGHGWRDAGVTGLLLAAASGYALGALWILPALRSDAPGCARQDTDHAVAHNTVQGDDRTTTLRLLHTAVDAVTGTAILLVWQRMYGAAEAGYLAILLRILGFVPAVIYAAWAHVMLASGTERRGASALAGVCGFGVTVALGLLGALTLQANWLPASWSPLLHYLLPVVLWQGSACLFGALSHLPFQQGRAATYSHAAIALDLAQLLVLCAPWILASGWSAQQHLWSLSLVSMAGLLGLSYWMALRREPSKSG